MDTFLIYGYALYKKISQWYYSKHTVDRYMVTEEGEQIRIFTPTSKRILGFVTVYCNNTEIYYKFSPNFNVDFVDFPTYKLLSIAFNGDTKQHSLDPKEFGVVGNILFNPLLNAWLCRKLNIKTISDTCILDENANMNCIHTLEFQKNKYITN
jgi:hypothetical protein